MPIERKLAAIMFTDIAGYTAQMSKNEDKALEMLRKKRSLIANHNGTYVKEIGDGTLSYFKSGYNASACAKELQKELQNDELNIKVVIHIGDIVFDDDDVYGDGVNIASRIESLAPAGGVLISKNVYDELINKDDFYGIALGLQSLKGVGRLVELYAIKDDYLVVPKLQDYKDTEIDVHKDDEVPSIAIIPFNNKGAHEDVFYAYGISADLISDCSGAGLIRVAGLNDIEKLDYANLKYEELSEKLLVRYIAQGTLWKMGEIFQLSVELYDTKDKKVVWSDRWQEKWDNLPTIKGSLSDGLLKALDTKPKGEQKIDTTNPEAYEFYLKAKHKYEKRENTDDTDIARGLLNKAIEIDANLIVAENLLGKTYEDMGDYDEAMEIYIPALKQSEELGDRRGMGDTLNNIGSIQHSKGDYEKALDYHKRSLAKSEKLGYKKGISRSLNSIGIMYQEGDYDKALEYYERSLAISEELGDNNGIVFSSGNIGAAHWYKGDSEQALYYYGRSLSIREEIGDKNGIGSTLLNIGTVHYYRGNLDTALDYLGKSLTIQKEIGLGARDLLDTTTYLYLTYKHLGKAYDVNEIHSLIKETESIVFELNLQLYELLENTSYLETAYNQIQENADNLESDVSSKFLSYPIPKAIVEEWEKVK